MNQPVKNADGATFQLAMLTAADGSQVQCVALVGADGSPITAWPLPTGAATEASLAAVLAKLPAAPALESGNLATLAGKDFATQTTLAQVLAALQTTLGVAVQSFPADYPDATSLAKLEQVRALLAAPLAVSGPLTDEQLRDTPLANPVGAASAEKQDELKALATEIRELAAQNKALLDTLLMFSVAVLEKMPILTSADAANVQVMNALNVTVGSGTLNTLQSFSGGNLSLIPWQITPSYIYDNLHVTP